MRERPEPTAEQKANLAEMDAAMRNVYTYTRLAHDLLDQSKELKKSQLLNGTISQIQEVKRYAEYIDKGDQTLQSKRANWVIAVQEAGTIEVNIVCVVTCTYRDALRVAVCLQPVFDVIERQGRLAKNFVWVGEVLHATEPVEDIKAGEL